MKNEEAQKCQYCNKLGSAILILLGWTLGPGTTGAGIGYRVYRTGLRYCAVLQSALHTYTHVHVLHTTVLQYYSTTVALLYIL